MKQALEALEANQPVNYCVNNNGERFPMMQEDPFRFERNTKAITAIREALAEQPAQEQEPFGYFRYDLRLDAWVQNREERLGTAFYTSPPPRKPLTDEEIGVIVREAAKGSAIRRDGSTSHRIARAIEAAHGIKEKNT